MSRRLMAKKKEGEYSGANRLINPAGDREERGVNSEGEAIKT